MNMIDRITRTPRVAILALTFASTIVVLEYNEPTYSNFQVQASSQFHQQNNTDANDPVSLPIIIARCCEVPRVP